MSLMTIFSAVSTAVTGRWRMIALILAAVLLVGLLTGYAAWRGYHAGYERADAERRAEVSGIRADHALALAEAESRARAMLEAETARTYALERQYLDATKTIAAQRRQITNRRIEDASRNVAAVDGRCLFGPDWVRLYNEAIGAGDSDRAVPGAAPGPDAAATAAQTAGAWIPRGGGPLMPAVTPQDILAHIRDYGARCRELEAQLNGLIDWAEGRPTREETWK
ncbi:MULTISPECIES: hypothetical protein [Pseudodesulfovibrio]|nr:MULTISPECIES: hypothetical protein [Pseudodesulfovibrio]